VSEALLLPALDELVDDCADACGDWDGVLARAGIAVGAPAPEARPAPVPHGSRRPLTRAACSLSRWSPPRW
jgi:hypothetical protein